MRKASQTFISLISTCINATPVRRQVVPQQNVINDILTKALADSYELLLTEHEDAEKALVDMEVILDHGSSVLLSLHSQMKKKTADFNQSGGFMKKIHLMTIFCAFLISACSHDPFKAQREKNDMIVEHMKQGKQYVGGEFDARFNQSGNDGMTLRSVGTSMYPIQTNEELSRAKAVSMAKFKLIESAPTEFKSLVQQAIGNSLGYTGEFTKIETSITEVHALRGIEVKEEDTVCKMVVEPTIEGGYSNMRECRSIARIPLVELNKAFNFTMEQKYGPQQKNSVERLLEEQLKANTLISPVTKVVSTQE